MGAEVFFWFMVVSFGGGGGQAATIMPVPYQTAEMCEWAAENSEGNRGAYYTCIPQPAADLAQFSMLSSTEGNVCTMEVK